MVGDYYSYSHSINYPNLEGGAPKNKSVQSVRVGNNRTRMEFDYSDVAKAAEFVGSLTRKGKHVAQIQL